MCPNVSFPGEGWVMVVGKFHRTVRCLAAWPLIAISVVTAFPSATHAQITLFNSNGFEPATFTTGNIGAFYGGGGPAGQQGYLTTDISQLLGTPAGNIQTGTVLNGTQAFQINGNNLFDDGTFAGQTFFYRNYPTAGTAFNPVGSGTPLVRIAYDRMTRATLNLNEMPLVGTYMEGYAQSDNRSTRSAR